MKKFLSSVSNKLRIIKSVLSSPGYLRAMPISESQIIRASVLKVLESELKIDDSKKDQVIQEICDKITSSLVFG